MMSGLGLIDRLRLPAARIDGERIMRHQGGLMPPEAVLYRHLWHSFGAWQNRCIASILQPLAERGVLDEMRVMRQVSYTDFFHHTWNNAVAATRHSQPPLRDGRVKPFLRLHP